MKGIIFTSFIEFAGQQFDEAYVEEMLQSVPLSTSGAYTNVGTYPARELLDMVGYILDREDLDPAEMQRAFGEHTFGVLTRRYSKLITGFQDSFECIYHVDQVIHRDVRKLYPDAELPNMNAEINDAGDTLTLEYRSSRPLMHVAHGLIDGCIKHYGDDVSVHMTDLSGGTGTHSRFVLTRHG